MNRTQKQTLVREMQNGMRLGECCRLLGLTLEEVRAAEKTDKAFARETRRAPIVFKRYLVRIVAMGESNWQSAAFILERRWPRQWGKRRPKEIPKPEMEFEDTDPPGLA
ncbi:MAG: hypothetical protein IT461_13150 [Planctomycetes bacterium]|nr:hypothetical protein [Planctomycetota bacterium]